jgi:NitT/TauT family transport system ATP-binding protein
LTTPPDPATSFVVELRSVCKSFANDRGQLESTVEDVSFAIPRQPGGRFLALLGPSGCGKSTILNMVGGAFPPDRGDVLIDGATVRGDVPSAVTVPQRYTCFPWLSAKQNVEFGLKLQGKSNAESDSVAADYLKRVGLLEHAAKYPNQLSGGMQQRIALARTLAMKPEIILMDEPFGALDAQTREDMQRLLLDLWQQEGSTILFVTHDIAEALLLADEVILFTARPARILQKIEVPFPRPRSYGVDTSPEFNQMISTLRGQLRQGTA